MILSFESTYLSENDIFLEWIYFSITLIICFIILTFFEKYILKNLLIRMVFLFLFLFYGINLYYSKIVPSLLIKDSLENKSYKMLEGVVQNFKPMNPSGHEFETFNINDIEFRTTWGNLPGDKTMFFNLTKHYGSPIQNNGQFLKIYYLEKKDQQFCLFFLPECLIFEGENKNRIIKLWVRK